MTKDMTKIDSLIDQLVSDFLTKREMSSLNENARLISEAVSIYEIGDAFIDSLKRDLSILLKNVSKVKKADQITEYIKAVQRFRARLELMVGPYSADMYNAKIGETPLHKLFYKLKKEKEIERFAYWYRDSLYSFLTELYVADSVEPRRIGGSYLEIWWEKEKNKWKARVQRKAKKFFEDFRNALRSFDIEGQHIRVPEAELEEIHGHPVVTVGYDPDDQRHKKRMEIIVQGIKQAKEAVAKRFPTLLPRSLTIAVNFTVGLDFGGRYLSSFGAPRTPAIELSHYKENPKQAAMVIIHEAAHDYWKNKLNESARQRWTKLYEANMTGRLDLKKLKNFWDKNRNKSFVLELINDTSMKTEDPQLYLQLSYLIGKRDERFNISKREDLERAIRNNEVWVVPKQPITWYAGKNEEEMFCESVATYVMFGEKAMPDFILANLKAIIGSPLK